MSRDGGLTAIGGFLYQTVVALSLKADTFQVYDAAPNRHGDLETVLGFAKDGELRYEDEDQDVSIREVLHGAQPGYILVQIKYSSVFPCPSISEAGVKEILSGLQKSEERVRVRGEEVTGYSLLTNRPLSAKAQQLAASHPHFYVASSLPERYWEERLRQFARRFGCIDSEIEAGIRQGIADILLKATNPGYYGNPVISREMLIELFTGCPTAQMLTPEIVARKSHQQLNQLCTESFDLDRQPLLVRNNIQKQLSDLVEQHAFVVLSGTGGNGKTAALWQWMRESLSPVLPQQVGRYYCLSPSQWVQEDFLAGQFCTWARVTNNRYNWRYEEIERILDRLEIARAASGMAPSVSHPVVVLGLDAIDEAFLQGERKALRTLLLWFWKQEVLRCQRPRATLIVTCRDSKELARRWMNITSHYEEEQQQPFRQVEVSVDTFSAIELVALAELQLPALAARFVQAYRASKMPSALVAAAETFHSFNVHVPTLLATVDGEMEASAALLPESPSVPAMDAEVFEALCHPTLWHCLLNIEGTTQARVLDGEAEALAQLARRFVFWFCSKGQARGGRAQTEEMIEVLHAIAHRCNPRRSPCHQKKDWLMPASTKGFMTERQARNFFEEALSAGLIVSDNGGWRWRHPFVGEYLALQPPGLEED